MNDLWALLWSAKEDIAATESKTGSSSEADALRALVGAPTVEVSTSSPSRGIRELAGARPASPTAPAVDLQHLFGPPRPPVANADHTLSALVGEPETTDRVVSSPELSAMVGPREERSEADQGWRAPNLAQAGRRPLFGGRRKAGAVNYTSLVVATIAVFALVGTASFAVVQRATANPADAAMISLREREAELANETKVLQTAVDLFTDSVAEAVSLAETSAPILAALEGRVGAEALALAENARGVLSQRASSAASVSVPLYKREAIDERSLDQVGTAIDEVRLAREALPPLITQARDSRSSVVVGISDYRAALGSLGTAIRSEATELVAANDSAGSAFSEAVTDAAAQIVSAQQAGGDGLADMPTYAAAVDALRAENARIVAREQAEREATPNRPSNPNGNGNNRDPDSDSSDPGTPSPEPSQPAPSPDPEPSPEPTQPEPTPDPEPTEPSVPNPDPTAPIEGGTV